jgi:predicted enzyme related to lactoylglutathione lyase
VSEEEDPASGGPRLEAVILEVSDLETSEILYREGFGLPLHPGDNEVEDRWIGGRHAEISWRDGAYLHFALYGAKQEPTARVQLTFAVENIDEAHAAAVRAGARVVHQPRSEPWGRSGRYQDLDGNIVELTERP